MSFASSQGVVGGRSVGERERESGLQELGGSMQTEGDADKKWVG